MLVKNPNYDPNNRNSQRYVAENVAVQNAQTRADNVNSLTSPKTPITADNFYTIRSGDNLGNIAQANNTSVDALTSLNNIPDRNVIQAGSQLRIPGATVPQTPQGAPGQPVPTQPSISDLARQSGEAGLSLQDFSTIASRPVSSTDRQGIKDTLGITEKAETLFERPEKSTTEIYKSFYEGSGLREVQKQIAGYDEEISAKQANLTEAIGKIKGNPWISQATRTGRLGQLQELAQNEIGNLIDSRDSALDRYDTGIDEIEKSIGYIQDDFRLGKEIGTSELNYLLGEAEREEAIIEAEDLTATLRYVPDYLKGIKKAEERDIANELRIINARKTEDTRLSTLGYEELLTYQPSLYGIPTQLINSNEERERFEGLIDQAVVFGKTNNMSPADVVLMVQKDMLGFRINPGKDDVAKAILPYLQTLSGVEASDYQNTARLINSGNTEQAIVRIEKRLLQDASNEFVAKQTLAEGTAVKTKEILVLLDKIDINDLGTYDGRLNTFKRKFLQRDASLDVTRLEGKLTGLVQQYRVENLGTQVTEAEEAKLESLFATVNSSPDLIETQVQEFQLLTQQELNASRSVSGLPDTNYEILSGQIDRISGYSGFQNGSSPQAPSTPGTPGVLLDDINFQM